ncbi:hypothetical protein [Burkholderia pseudomallei]|uniref:hypothetical protein n=1 Tax=Burkholderia pseudomallei TaxID=28450 RepID=UPI0001A48677|nr:hypothetical protein [Burkholderia pseudomallei]ACQ97417.1 conserved hypothetical protein [Burkholderia pseudomallei MSHR346]AIP09579.1 hypothetical protein DP55_927 [Burkholderia pseudomallei]APY99697.1 hypothetical protein BGI49_12280 [Burkholderia pseudomallei]APZ13286.1 hypothetical protein BGI52_12380 [Burkholderia pseudomallei]EQA88356.1 hypothetical protein M218_14030 [Burkholderia pseudomallei MSHR338]
MANLTKACECSAARAAKKQADAEFYESELERHRDRFADAHARSNDEVRREAASWIAAAAAVFERMPSRTKRAVELFKHAVFMLDSKTPA